MNRLFCCGITCESELNKIKDLIIKLKDSVDGFVWCVDESNSDTIYHFLDENKKEGKIVKHQWQNAHDWQANEWLHCNTFEEGDWIWMFDSSESPTDFWIKYIREHIKILEQKNITALFFSGRPYLFKYSDYLYFFGTPHWGLYGLLGNAISIEEQTKNTYIINKRDLNPDKHYQEHDTKYYLYGRSNQMQMFYGKYGQEIINYHEQIRIQFRSEMKNLGYQCNLTDLEKCFKKGGLSEFIQDTIELEFCLSEFYQRKILNMDFMTEIVPRRKKWSFKEYLLNGNGYKDGYESTIDKYNKQFRIIEK